MDLKKLIIGIIVILMVLVGGYYYSIRPQKEQPESSFLKDIKKEGKITIGMEASYPPMEDINKKGEFEGMDVDIAKEIAKDLGVKPEFKDIPWDHLFGAVQNGEVDMAISAITITMERAKKMDFSVPYFNAGQVVVVREGQKNDIKGVEDLKDKKVGVQVKTTSAEEARKYISTSSVITYDNYDTAKKELLEGEINGIIIDYPAAVGLVKNEDLTIVGNPFTEEFYGVAVQKGRKELLSRINETIREMKKEKRIEELREKWLAK